MGQLEEINTISVPESIYGSSNKQALLKKYNIPIQHFDFAYIEGCADARELEKILHILKSGEEGYYPQLIAKTEERLSKIKPNSKYVRKLTPVLSRYEIDNDSSKKITEDLNSWFNDINKRNMELSEVKTVKFNIPEVRKPKEDEIVKKENTPKRISSTDYAAWDKYDPDTEMLKMDLEEEKLRKEAEKMAKATHKKRTVKFNDFVTSAEASSEAQRESLIANEYFKAGEYENALEHHTNSIVCFPSATSYANRGATYLRLKKYEQSIADYRVALTYQSNNCEYILQMGKCYSGLEKWAEALNCAETAIKIDPNNKTAQILAEKARKLCGGAKDLGKVRLKIVDTETKRAVAPKKSILKKEEKSEIIPIPGSSKMHGPYYKIVRSNDPKVINKEKQMINCNRKAVFMTNIEITSDDDDCDCTETHVKPSRSSNAGNKCTGSKSTGNVEDLKCFSMQTSVNKNNQIPSKTESEIYNIDNNSKEEQKSKIIRTNTSMDGDNNINCISGVNHVTNNVKNDDSFTVNSQGEREVNASLNRLEQNHNDLGGGGEPFTEDDQDHINTVDVNMPFSFVQAWQSARRDGSYAGFASILRYLNVDRITEVIGNKIDATILSEILNSLYRYFMVADEVERVYNILLNLCRLDRFGIVIMFLSENDKRLVQNLLNFLKQHGRDLPENIRKEYM